MNIGTRIKNRRKDLKMSAEELARRLGKDRSTIYRYEKGDIENMPLDILDPIAKALDTSPAYLMGWVSEETENRMSKLAGLTKQLREDDVLLEMVETLAALSEEKRAVIRPLLVTLARE